MHEKWYFTRRFLAYLDDAERALDIMSEVEIPATMRAYERATMANDLRRSSYRQVNSCTQVSYRFRDFGPYSY